jgi:tetrahydromethanopterin S-methyltransferase subunit G
MNTGESSTTRHTLPNGIRSGRSENPRENGANLNRRGVRLDTKGDRAEGAQEPGWPFEPDLTRAPNHRLVELERKVDLLLSEKEERLSHAKILERLHEVERKLDQRLGGRR